ncbi:hypothetical protein I3760_08G029100 [Carya illinoinensis]|nr:hypothetical protein I3760_08G029100 [Carya illinoinensis]
MAETKISLKLVIDNKRNRVLLAEAGKDFVDFLLEAFTLPVVTVARFLKNEDSAGSLQSLYNSIENLSNSFIRQTEQRFGVKDPNYVTYMVMDDLEIKPMSVDPFITLLNDHNIKELGAIEKKVIDVSMDEAALQSKTVLTDVFLSRPSETGESIMGQVKAVLYFCPINL